MVWDRLRPEQRACVLFVPPSHPPRAIHGELVSCFLTPDGDALHTHPPALADELRKRFGAYRPDVEEFRGDDLPRILQELYAGAEQRFGICEYLLRTRQPTLTALVEIGPDRFHHAFWAHIDPDHPRHVPGNAYADAGRQYYAFLDRQIGRLLTAAGPDMTVLVVSDHGARPLLGCIHINEWLIERGYLVLERYPERITPLSQLAIDWRRTRAFGEGGYYARIMLNVEGREPQGCVPKGAARELRERLRRELRALPGPHGEALATRVVSPDEAYREVRGLPPDLSVFFDDLGYRALGTVGHRSVYGEVDDRGLDACNHAWDGMFVMSGPECAREGHSKAYATPTLRLLCSACCGSRPRIFAAVDQRGLE